MSPSPNDQAVAATLSAHSAGRAAWGSRLASWRNRVCATSSRRVKTSEAGSYSLQRVRSRNFPCWCQHHSSQMNDNTV